MRIALGSENKAKRRALEMTVEKLFPGAEIVCVKVPSGVSDQPSTDEEAMRGAENRARAAREATDADFGVGLEAGYHPIGDKFFECGWAAIVRRDGRVGLGSSGRFELSSKLVRILKEGKELADVIDGLTGRTDVRHEEGMYGLITKGHVTRDQACCTAMLIAFGPFVSDPIFWD